MTKEELLARLEERKAITPTGCWLFSGPKTENKREIFIGDRNFLVTRVSASIFKNLNLAITTKLVCHYSFCPEPNCWNPDHYYIGDSSSNIRDAVEDGVHKNGNTNKITCKNGHSLSNPYLYTDLNGNVHRYCRACRRTADFNHKRKVKR